MNDRLENRIRELREAAGLTQIELASRMGVSRKTVNTIENGIFMPSAIVALKMARELGRPVEEIFWLEGAGGVS